MAKWSELGSPLVQSENGEIKLLPPKKFTQWKNSLIIFLSDTKIADSAKQGYVNGMLASFFGPDGQVVMGDRFFSLAMTALVGSDGGEDPKDGINRPYRVLRAIRSLPIEKQRIISDRLSEENAGELSLGENFWDLEICSAQRMAAHIRTRSTGMEKDYGRLAYDLEEIFETILERTTDDEEDVIEEDDPDWGFTRDEPSFDFF